MFGERIKESRLKLGLTQQKIADEIGITKTHYCDIENSNRYISKIEHFDKLMNLLLLWEIRGVMLYIMLCEKLRKDSVEYAFIKELWEE